jgi:hypothetical protein
VEAPPPPAHRVTIDVRQASRSLAASGTGPVT